MKTKRQINIKQRTKFQEGQIRRICLLKMALIR